MCRLVFLSLGYGHYPLHSGHRQTVLEEQLLVKCLGRGFLILLVFLFLLFVNQMELSE